jgi:hypothetical protein
VTLSVWGVVLQQRGRAETRRGTHHTSPETGMGGRMSVAWRKRGESWIQAQVAVFNWPTHGPQAVPHAVSSRRFCRGKGPGSLLSPSPSFDSACHSLAEIGTGGGGVGCIQPQELKYLAPCMLLAATRDLDRFAACSELFQPALGIPNTGQTRLKSIARAMGREAGTLIRG